MKEITEYKVISEREFFSLAATVNLSIKEGWQPMGGITMFIDKGKQYGEAHTRYAQALVKYKP